MQPRHQAQISKPTNLFHLSLANKPLPKSGSSLSQWITRPHNSSLLRISATLAQVVSSNEPLFQIAKYSSAIFFSWTKKKQVSDGPSKSTPHRLRSTFYLEHVYLRLQHSFISYTIYSFILSFPIYYQLHPLLLNINSNFNKIIFILIFHQTTFQHSHFEQGGHDPFTFYLQSKTLNHSFISMLNYSFNVMLALILYLFLFIHFIDE